MIDFGSYRAVEQRPARGAHNAEVVGSNPTRATISVPRPGQAVRVVPSSVNDQVGEGPQGRALSRGEQRDRRSLFRLPHAIARRASHTVAAPVGLANVTRRGIRRAPVAQCQSDRVTGRSGVHFTPGAPLSGDGAVSMRAVSGSLATHVERVLSRPLSTVRS